MRRAAPRPLAVALDDVSRAAAPATLLARVQACWAEVVGDAIATAAQPLSERDGTLTVAVESAAWASELELLAPDLLDRLNAALEPAAESPLRRLRAKVAPRP